MEEDLPTGLASPDQLGALGEEEVLLLGRTAVTDSIKQLCRDARVPEEKANPRCLKRLWQSTQDGIRTQIDLLVEQACDRLMEAEQLTVGWDVGKGVSDV